MFFLAPTSNVSKYLHHLNKGLDIYLEDFHSEIKNNCLNNFSNVNDLKNFNKEQTCFKH